MFVRSRFPGGSMSLILPPGGIASGAVMQLKTLSFFCVALHK